MPDVASHAAPAATNGAASVQTSAPAAPAARNNAGQFSPKDGAQAKSEQPPKPVAPAAPATEKKPEPYRFKRKVDDQDVDLDEAGLEQSLKELAWRRKQQNEVAATKKEIAELMRLAKEDKRGFFSKLGVDPRQAALEDLQEMARLERLTPEQRELEQAKADLERGRRELDGEKQKIADAAKKADRERIQAANRHEYEQALGHSVLPHSRAKLFLMTQIQRGLTESGAPKLTPEQLGRAYDDMMLSAFDEVVKAAGTKPETLTR